MSIRIALLVLMVLYFSIYAWKNWFVSLCAAVLLLAVVQHPDFPSNVGGIQGLNPWNFLLLNVVMAWMARRHQEGLTWDLPRAASWMLFGYMVVVLTAACRLIVDPNRPLESTIPSVISEDIVNCIKWVVPGLLLFDACRTRRRVVTALVIILGLYFLLAVQVIRWVPLSAASGGDLSYRASRMIQNEVGYNRVTMSMMLAGASWAALAAVVLVRRPAARFVVLGVAGTIAMGQALTGGRSGYIAWAVVGVALGLVRWPRLLAVIPVALLMIVLAFPSVRERMLQGVSLGSSGPVQQGSDAYEMTSGRNLAWPKVIARIEESPVLGYGRHAMATTGIENELMTQAGESFPHPHQAYLEVLLDNGIIGFIIIIPFYLYALRRSFEVLRERDDQLVTVVGAVAFSLVLALMVGAFGGQTFYPREGAVGMWAAVGLMLRVSVNRYHALQTGEPVFEDDDEDEQASGETPGEEERERPATGRPVPA